ncbi:DUF4249 domain-containing protein [Mucilaginibacter sp. FT3.2]|uniref:DUF4249 domain-containing protein n=1 Tax=Mucilaginibacter sp. FT3.2 TaxID=2723090 RepID=UPI001619E73B|nr:DUF4249 domain-containing protein [Mucilaginibacter sp. FT3.2]MBB6232703.1 hypothetical protein [Mucilaginibacter sp. FT3.2]
MIRYRYIWYLIVTGSLATACRKPYNPTIVSSDNSYLVIEGVINSGSDPTVIKLSKTTKISDNIQTSTLVNYIVNVEDEAKNAIVLQSGNNGQYTSGGGLNLDVTKKYRLHIITPDGKEYASDYEPVKPTPPIDSIGFAPKDGNLQIYVNAHDATNNTRYYRWDFNEAWKFHSNFQSDFVVDPNLRAVTLRTKDQLAYYCYASDSSSNILINSTAKLGQDVVFQAPITTIPSSSERIELRYSILLKQYALTKEAYAFWENMKKNTEQLGSIFDAQPSQLIGNIHCVSNPAEPVIGYISVTNISTKRIYIDNSQLPQSWITKSPYDCSIDSALFLNPKNNAQEVENYIINGSGIPLGQIMGKMNNVIGFTYSTIECSDCRIRGKSQPPSFWIAK